MYTKTIWSEIFKNEEEEKCLRDSELEKSKNKGSQEGTLVLSESSKAQKSRHLDSKSMSQTAENTSNGIPQLKTAKNKETQKVNQMGSNKIKEKKGHGQEFHSIEKKIQIKETFEAYGKNYLDKSYETKNKLPDSSPVVSSFNCFSPNEERSPEINEYQVSEEKGELESPGSSPRKEILLKELEKLQKNFEYQTALLKNLRNFWVLRLEELKESKMDLEDRLQWKSQESKNLSECIQNSQDMLQPKKSSPFKRSFQGTASFQTQDIGTPLRRSNSSLTMVREKEENKDQKKTKKGSFLQSLLSFIENEE